jgi:hypothetical protein
MVAVSLCLMSYGQEFKVVSPDDQIILTIINGDNLFYNVTFKSRPILRQSGMGFEFKNEQPMTENFDVIDQSSNVINEIWNPVVRSKHAEIINNYNELILKLKEKAGAGRIMELHARAYDDGVAFTFRLLRGARPGDRQIIKELTTFSVPGDPKACIVEYRGGYSSSNESEFFERSLSYLTEKSIAGMPLLMDYTPGGFLNVRKDQFKQQTPALVWNTRAAELSKFVIYESPLTVVCDHPDHILNQPGADFLMLIPTVWDDIKFLGGYPADYVALAKRNGDEWFIGVMNNSIGKTVEIKIDFLPPGTYEADIWADARNSDKEPSVIRKMKQRVKSGATMKVSLANNGDWVAILRSK